MPTVLPTIRLARHKSLCGSVAQFVRACHGLGLRWEITCSLITVVCVFLKLRSTEKDVGIFSDRLGPGIEPVPSHYVREGPF